jgi:hypothetical protein
MANQERGLQAIRERLGNPRALALVGSLASAGFSEQLRLHVTTIAPV